MNLLLLATTVLRIGGLLKAIVELIKPHLVLAVFVTATPVVLHMSPWPERILIGLSVLSAALLGARIGNRDGLPKFLS